MRRWVGEGKFLWWLRPWWWGWLLRLLEWTLLGRSAIWLVIFWEIRPHGRHILHSVATLTRCGHCAQVSGDCWHACLGVISVVLFLWQICHWWCCFHYQYVGSAWRIRLAWITWERSCCWSIWQRANIVDVGKMISLGGGVTNRVYCIWLRAWHKRNWYCLGPRPPGLLHSIGG